MTRVPRATRLAQLERQIRLNGVARASYARTMQRAEAAGDARRAAEYGQRLAEAVAVGYGLRAEWFRVKIDLCRRMASRKQPGVL